MPGRTRRSFAPPPQWQMEQNMANLGPMPQPGMMPGVPTQAPGIGAAQQQHAAALAAQVAAAQAPPGGMGPQMGAAPGPMPANLSTLGDMARLQAQNQVRAAGAPGQGWNLAQAAAMGGLGGGLGGSPIGAGVGAGAAGLMELLRQRRAKQPLKQAKGGLVKEPQRMAMGGAAKVRKDFPRTGEPPKKNSFSNPLNGHPTAVSRGMGKAKRGGTFKGSL